MRATDAPKPRHRSHRQIGEIEITTNGIRFAGASYCPVTVRQKILRGRRQLLQAAIYVAKVAVVTRVITPTYPVNSRTHPPRNGFLPRHGGQSVSRGTAA